MNINYNKAKRIKSAFESTVYVNAQQHDTIHVEKIETKFHTIDSVFIPNTKIINRVEKEKNDIVIFLSENISTDSIQMKIDNGRYFLSYKNGYWYEYTRDNVLDVLINAVEKHNVIIQPDVTMKDDITHFMQLYNFNVQNSLKILHTKEIYKYINTLKIFTPK